MQTLLSRSIPLLSHLIEGARDLRNIMRDRGNVPLVHLANIALTRVIDSGQVKVRIATVRQVQTANDHREVSPRDQYNRNSPRHGDNRRKSPFNPRNGFQQRNSFTQWRSPKPGPATVTLASRAEHQLIGRHSVTEIDLKDGAHGHRGPPTAK